MTSAQELGRLERVELRDAWEKEDLHFTPWLANEENLALLGEAIGLELELEATERDVGPFRADILCKEAATDNWVLIENQLERTDHTHLGQLITYAAGLQTATVVWVAARFTDEHRAALDWLNEITDERFRFFGLEIELWRIGSSIAAPKFNIISKPNDWTRSVAAGAKRGELTETQKLQIDYWSALGEHLEEEGSVVHTGKRKAQPQNWRLFAIGRSNFHLNAAINTRNNQLSAMLVLFGSDAKPHFHLLHAEREAIETEFGEAFEWLERPGRTESHIVLRWDADPTDRASWPTQHAWLRTKLETFYKTFKVRVKALDVSDYQPDDDA